MAGVAFRGDSRKLKALIGNFHELSTRRFRERLNRDMAEAALELMHEGFDRGITPYGDRWRKLKYRKGQPLRDTRRLESSIRPIASASRFELATSVIYAGVHLYGYGPVPQRQYLPTSTHGFGGRWRRALFAVAHKNVTETLGRR